MMMKAAIYARYSTDMQRKESIEDQHRVCDALCQRHGFKVAAKFSDAAMSGGTSQRPGYQDMLRAARRKEFDVIVAEDTSRLWRNLSEQSPRLAELSDLGIIVVTADLDTRSESAGILGAVTGAMGEQYRKEIGRRTRRGLEGLARNGKSAGGRSYGYVPASESGTGQIEIDKEQAAVVVRAYQLAADGYAAGAIAAIFNREGIPSPGASWGRSQRRKSGWVGSVIYGDLKRGTGILANPIYVGKVIWNRTRWIRSAADSSKRRQVQNPPTEWITRQEERLRIVPDDLWQRVQARQKRQAQAVNERVKGGLSRSSAIHTGVGPKFLLSSLLRCAQCGSAFAIAGRDFYQCSGYTNSRGSLCSNNAVLRRTVAEAKVLAGIKAQMQCPEVLKEIARRTRAALQQATPKTPDRQPRIIQVSKEVQNMVDAIAGGILKPSAALAAKLATAEAELEQLRSAVEADQQPKADIGPMLANLPAMAKRAVEKLEETLAGGNVGRAREEIRDRVGTVSIEADSTEIRLYSQYGHVAETLLRVGNGANTSNYGSGGRI
jgi:site-specific DNA recombinase